MLTFTLSLLIGATCLQSFLVSSTEEDYYLLDGSANLYKVTSADLQVEYTPVKPENSSSGLYSGGEYCKKTITKEQYSLLSQKIKEVVQNKKIRIQDRVKGSYALTIKKGKKEESYLISKGGKEIQEVESYLKGLIL